MSHRLITESFPKVKKAGRAQSQRKAEPKAGTSKAEPAVTARVKEEPSQFEKDMTLLKQFDMDWRYGPCTGITRMERWNRAQKHDLDPPDEVRDLISQHSGEEVYTHGLWKDYEL